VHALSRLTDQKIKYDELTWHIGMTLKGAAMQEQGTTYNCLECIQTLINGLLA
jgi:hypothetical protein